MGQDLINCVRKNTLYKILSRASFLLKILVNVASKLFYKMKKDVKRLILKSEIPNAY